MAGLVVKALEIQSCNTRLGAVECIAKAASDNGYSYDEIGYNMRCWAANRFKNCKPSPIHLQRQAILNVCQKPKTTDELIAKFPEWDANDLSSVLSELECDGYLIAKSNDTTDILWKVNRKRYEEKD